MKQSERRLLSAIAIIACIAFGACHQQPRMIDPSDISYPPLSFQPPPTSRSVLENGMVLHFLEDSELPMVNLTIAVHTGSAFDPSEKEGLAELTGTVMRTGGAGVQSGGEIDEEIDFMAADLTVSVNREITSFRLSVNVKDLNRSLAILSDIIRHPRFENDKFSTAQALKIEGLKRIIDNSQKLAFREFIRRIYDNDPRGRIPTIASIQKITPEDCRVFHRDFFRPGNMMVSFSGPLNMVQALASLNHAFGKWKNSVVPENKLPAPQPHRERRIYFIPKSSPQSVIVVGWIVPGKNDVEHHAIETLDFTYGSGGFRSRIFSEIRNRRGLAYSAGSFYSARSDFGVIAAYAMTNPAATTEVLSLILSIGEDLRNGTITSEEIVWTRKSLVNSFIFSFNTPETSVYQEMLLEFEGIRKDYLRGYTSKIDLVAGDAVTAAARRYIDPSVATILVLGPGEKIERSLSGFGQVVTVNITN
ncbi:MAG: insulinase family protein [Deltaproteobacteria bacterium]|nr:insulinase family protein [Deltaproteobacteria bacterium]